MAEMTTEQRIWQYLTAKGFTSIAAAGIMGNLYAESALKPTNLQNTSEKSLGMRDEAYTAAVDNGSYTNFANDHSGYGLAQWTYYTRKQALLDRAKKAGKSIGDLELQLDFLVEELNSMGLVKNLNACSMVREASNIILLQFEKPANQDQAVQDKRTQYSFVYFNKYASTVENTVASPNSPLVNFTKLSPHCTKPRNHTIDTITIHCMAGNLTVESCGSWFANPSAKCSSNYGVDSNGKIGLYVEEKNRSWCSSSPANDHRAITIEVANNGTAADGWPVSAAAMSSIIALCADICRRNKIKQLLWKADKSLIGQVDKQNMTVHRWFANKDCPGAYLYNRMGYITEQVNKALSTVVEPANQEPALNETALRQLIKEEVAKELQRRNPNYADIKDVPEYWRSFIQVLLDLDIINGGTPRDVNDTDVNLTQDTIKALVILKQYVDSLLNK